MKLDEAEALRDRLDEKAPDGVHYEVGDSSEGELLYDEPEFGGFYVKRVVERGRVNS